MKWYVALRDGDVRVKEFTGMHGAKNLAFQLGHNGSSDDGYYTANARVELEDGFISYTPRYKVGEGDDMLRDPIEVMKGFDV